MAEEEEDAIDCTPFEKEIYDLINEIRSDPSKQALCCFTL